MNLIFKLKTFFQGVALFLLTAISLWIIYSGWKNWQMDNYDSLGDPYTAAHLWLIDKNFVLFALFITTALFMLLAGVLNFLSDDGKWLRKK